MYSCDYEDCGANLNSSELCDFKEQDPINSVIKSESDRKLMRKLIYIYKRSNPIEKYIINYFIKQTETLLNLQPLQLPVGLEHYD